MRRPLHSAALLGSRLEIVHQVRHVLVVVATGGGRRRATALVRLGKLLQVGCERKGGGECAQGQEVRIA